MTDRLRCPTCEREFPLSEPRYAPFCSERCQRIDLGRWLRERHSVPVPPSFDDEGDGEDHATLRARRDPDES